MATFFSGQNIGYWSSSSNTMYGTLTGNVGRSGNTVTLSGMSLSITSSQASYGTSSFTMTVNGTNTTKTINAPPTTMTLNNTSFGVTAAQTSKSVSWSTSDGRSGSFNVTFPSGATKPTGLKATYSSCTWNSVTASASVSGWGGVSGSSLQFVLNSASNNFNNPRRAYQVATTGTSGSKTGTNSNYHWQYDSTFSLRGCKRYYLSGWGENSAGLTAEYFDTTARYLPPSPMTALSITSQTGSNTADSVTVNFSATGGNSTNNENVSVQTQFRYSTNNGTSWSAWSNAGSAATPWTARTGTFTVPYNTSTLLQARQVYQNQYSETKQISFTSIKSTDFMVKVDDSWTYGNNVYIKENDTWREVGNMYVKNNNEWKLGKNV